MRSRYSKAAAVGVGVAIAVAIYLNVDSTVGKALGILAGVGVGWGMLSLKR